MRRAGLVLAMGLSAASMGAQMAEHSVGEACPVGFAAAVNGRAIARAAADTKAGWPAPLMELSFGRGGQDVVGATVTIHGEVPAGRYLLAGQASTVSRMQTFELNGMRGDGEVSVQEVVVDKMAFVRWAELTELRFADGSAWHPQGMARCRAFPSAARQS